MEVLVADFMQRDVRSVAPDTTFEELERALNASGLGGMPVLDRGRLVGVVSRADLLRQGEVAATRADGVLEYFRDPGVGPGPAPQERAQLIGAQLVQGVVRDAMTTRIVSVPSTATAEDVAAVLIERGVHRVLVVDDGVLVGIVSSMDLVRLLADGRLTDAAES